MFNLTGNYQQIFGSLFLVLTVVLVNAADVGRPCKNSQISGICTVVTECELALTALSKGRPHNLKRCGFTNKGDDEIVCCPSTGIVLKEPVKLDQDTKNQSTDSRLSTKRKCEKVCEKLSLKQLSEPTDHIIGGKDSAEDEFPHMAAIGFPSDEGIQWSCGGSIISKQFILTAAHCFTKAVKPTKIRVGVTRLDGANAQDFNIKNTMVHQQYESTSKHNDIALVEIDGEIKFGSNTYPACLYADKNDPKEMIITGWGKKSTDQEDDRSIHLQKAMVVPYDLAKCNETYVSRSFGSKTIDRTQLCADTPPGQNQTDACWGDSGGPCQIKMKNGIYSIVSIISYGQQCGSRVPGVYTRVSAYLDWIESFVWNSI